MTGLVTDYFYHGPGGPLFATAVLLMVLGGLALAAALRRLGVPPSGRTSIAVTAQLVYPGLYPRVVRPRPPQPGSAFGVYWPALLDQAVLEHVVHHHDGSTDVIKACDPHGAGDEVTPQAESLTQPEPPPWTADELVVAALGEIVHARSGDKGGDANLGVWVRDRHAWEWLRSTLTVEELRRLLPEARDLAVSRYELPNLGAVNFVLHGLLGTGATSSLRLDAQAKALGEWPRARSAKVPRSLVRA